MIPSLQTRKGVNTIEKLEQMYHQFYEPIPQPVLEKIINKNFQELIQHLSKADKRLVLEIIDSKDLIICHRTQESFICGFQLALEIMSELKYENTAD